MMDRSFLRVERPWICGMLEYKEVTSMIEVEGRSGGWQGNGRNLTINWR